MTLFIDALSLLIAVITDQRLCDTLGNAALVMALGSAEDTLS
jgi:hypothetical protein